MSACRCVSLLISFLCCLCCYRQVGATLVGYQPDRPLDRPTAERRSDPREGWDRVARAVRVKNPRDVPLVITRAGTPVSNVIAAQSNGQCVHSAGDLPCELSDRRAKKKTACY
ncbi:hypothetical protein Bbelb_399310 [Branchiostoma belcheri]|nr:hypothetical protein Bbelb_399310 [Branchiostoma belcheri]